MNLLGRIRRLLSGGSHREPRKRRILVVGDSHAAAFEHAVDFTEDGSAFKQVEVFRFAKAKGDIAIGNISFQDFLELAASLDEQDYVFSVIGGNQYAVISTIQNPIDLEFLSGPRDRDIHSDDAMVIPNRTLSSYLYEALKGTLGEQLEAIQARTSANIFHLAPPPPKEDNQFIAKNFEERFAELGIGDLGPSRPQLRLKAWKLQATAMERLCLELGIALLPPPGNTITKGGFLDPYYYAKDATHANRRYGREALKQILALVGDASETSAEPAGQQLEVAVR